MKNLSSIRSYCQWASTLYLFTYMINERLVQIHKHTLLFSFHHCISVSNKIQKQNKKMLNLQFTYTFDRKQIGWMLNKKFNKLF